MALQSSGQISLQEIGDEANSTSSSTNAVSLNDASIRGLISKDLNQSNSFNEYYGVSSQVQAVNEGNINGQANIKEALVSDYISSGGTFQIPASFWIWSDNTSTAALTIDIPCTIINNGKIIGKGGRGGNAGYQNSDAAGLPGGPAIKINSGVSNVTITNNSGAYIAGGGGGGSTTPVTHASGTYQAGGGAGGGGAGGGAGGRGGARSGTTVSGGSNAAGGILNAAGSNGSYSDPYTGGGDSFANAGIGGGAGGGAGGSGGQVQYLADGGAGGRILPGTGGSGGTADGSRAVGGTAGGSAGNAGVSNFTANYSDDQRGYGASGGGGWGAAGGTRFGTAAAGGKAIEDSGVTYTLTNNGTVYGVT